MEIVMLILCAALLGAIVFLFLSNKKKQENLEALLSASKENEKQATEKVKKGELGRKELLEKLSLAQKKYKKLESKKSPDLNEPNKNPSTPSAESETNSSRMEELERKCEHLSEQTEVLERTGDRENQRNVDQPASHRHQIHHAQIEEAKAEVIGVTQDQTQDTDHL